MFRRLDIVLSVLISSFLTSALFMYAPSIMQRMVFLKMFFKRMAGIVKVLHAKQPYCTYALGVYLFYLTVLCLRRLWRTIQTFCQSEARKKSIREYAEWERFVNEQMLLTDEQMKKVEEQYKGIHQRVRPTEFQA